MTPFAGHDAFRTDPVEVTVDGIVLAGDLRLPVGASEPGPALVLTGPFTGVKDQVTGDYAARLAARGFVTLAFDHRNFGESGGPRRHHEDPAGKLADLSAATSALAAHPAVDERRIGCVGICVGGGYALKHSAFDPRIRALALVAAAFNDPRVMRSNIGSDGYRALMASFAEAAAREHATGEVELLAAVSDDDGVEAAMGGAEPFAYYGTARSASSTWENRVTRLSLRELLTFDAAMGAEFIDPTPTLIVHGRTDAFCSPEDARHVHERIDGPKRLVWLDTTNHIDLYDQPRFVDPAVDEVAAWMVAHLVDAAARARV